MRKRACLLYICSSRSKSFNSCSVTNTLEKMGLPYTTVVSAPSSAPAPMQFLLLLQVQLLNILEIQEELPCDFDDLQNRLSHTEVSLLLRRPPGRAYPGDVFYLHLDCWRDLQK